MFTSLFGTGEEDQGTSQQHHGGAPSARPSGLDLWGMANSLGNSVKASTEELLKSVQQTDWEAELKAFSKEAAEDAKALSHLTEWEKQQWRQERQEQKEQQMMQRSRPSPGAQQQQQQQAPTSERDGQQHILHQHHHLEEVGQQLRTFGQSLLLGTKEIIDQVRDAVESEIAMAARETKRSGRAGRSRLGATPAGHGASAAAKYNRFEAEVAAMQHDSSTYCDEPEDVEDYKQWLGGFDIQAAQPIINKVLADNAFLAELQSRIVPAIVERNDFWSRYFYRLHKLEVKEEARQNLAQRARAASAGDDCPSNIGGWDDGGGWGAWGAIGEASKEDDNDASKQGGAAEGEAAPEQADIALQQESAALKEKETTTPQQESTEVAKLRGSPKRAGLQSAAKKGQGRPTPAQQQQQRRRQREAGAEKTTEPPVLLQQQQQQQRQQQQQQQEQEQQHEHEQQMEQQEEEQQQQGHQQQQQQQQSKPQAGSPAQPLPPQEPAPASAISEEHPKHSPGAESAAAAAGAATGDAGVVDGMEGNQEGRTGMDRQGSKEMGPSASPAPQDKKERHSSSDSSRTEWLVVARDEGAKGGERSDVGEAAPASGEGVLLEAAKEGWEKEGDGVDVGDEDLPEEDAEDPWQEEVAGLEEKGRIEEGASEGGGEKKQGQKGGAAAGVAGRTVPGDDDEKWGDWD